MPSLLTVGDVEVDVVLKDIKNVHLSVHPPTGRVRISAPVGTNRETLRAFAISKLDWIKKHQTSLIDQEREGPREFLDRESQYVWGKRYLLRLVEIEEKPKIELGHSHVLLQVRPGTTEDKKAALVEHWYRDLVRAAMPPLLELWEPRLGVKVERFYIRHMKTMWGSCNHRAHTIRLNTELAKKPPECLEYIVVHELTHLLEPTHNARFIMLMNTFMPQWEVHREALNRFPVRHENWLY